MKTVIWHYRRRLLYERDLEKNTFKKGQVLLDTLHKAVTDALEKKRRLGQYAVVWRDGKPVAIGEDAQSSTDSMI
ncbi:MAG: hypothetical protein ACSLFH_14130 [Desulfuromonadales bacterium]